jgi:hypothetical protein
MEQRKASRQTANNNSHELKDSEIGELKNVYKKYHPLEKDKSLKVDDEYKRKLGNMLGIKIE